jgi:hypothetical protein
MPSLKRRAVAKTGKVVAPAQVSPQASDPVVSSFHADLSTARLDRFHFPSVSSLEAKSRYHNITRLSLITSLSQNHWVLLLALIRSSS